MDEVMERAALRLEVRAWVCQTYDLLPLYFVSGQETPNNWQCICCIFVFARDAKEPCCYAQGSARSVIGSRQTFGSLSDVFLCQI